MYKILVSISLLFFGLKIHSQTNPAITAWIQNTNNTTGRHYLSGNSTIINDVALANIQNVQYSTNFSYITTQGVPSFITGPFTANPNNVITAIPSIYKIPLNPVPNTGALTATGAGNIGVFINGVGLFSYGDGFSYTPASNSDTPAPNGVWRRDAVKAEIIGFDCAKAHPAAQGNYHHHQNPSAFNLDLLQLSTICNLYPSDGLYTINPTIHSPLIGFAYDGFPIYGAFGYTSTNGTGGISRMKSSYQLRNITTRTTYADGTDVVDGPPISSTFPLGWYREDYEYIAHPSDPSYLDEHNGRFCITPEYPSGIYCYFSTVDSNYNSTYPYCVGPTYYGVKNVVKVTAVTESTTPYLDAITFGKNDFSITIAPNPAQDFIAIQSQMAYSDYKIELIDELGKVIANSVIVKGSTLSVIDVQTVYSGTYFVKISNENATKTYKVIIDK